MHSERRHNNFDRPLEEAMCEQFVYFMLFVNIDKLIEYSNTNEFLFRKQICNIATPRKLSFVVLSIIFIYRMKEVSKLYFRVVEGGGGIIVMTSMNDTMADVAGTIMLICNSSIG